MTPVSERMAKCGCGNTVPSTDREKVFAFESTAEGSRNAVEMEFDRYYCGCRGYHAQECAAFVQDPSMAGCLSLMGVRSLEVMRERLKLGAVVVNVVEIEGETE